MRYMRWLQEQKFDHRLTISRSRRWWRPYEFPKERAQRLEAAIEEFLPQWSLAPVVQPL
jgi:transposase